MIFDEQEAREIIEKFNLSPTTLKVWKTRNKIPDKYLNPDFKILSDVESEKDKALAKELVGILKSGKLNVKSIARLCGVSEIRLMDIARGQYSFRQEELLPVKKGIQSIRMEAKNILNELSVGYHVPELAKKKLSKFLQRQEVYSLLVLRGDRLLNTKMYYYSEGKPFPDADIDRIRHCLLVFVTETTINF